jgi:hypothetical protein
MNTFRTSAALAALLVAAGLASLPARAASGHDHGHATSAKPLAQGQRWTTDAALREGMSGIRTAVEPQLKAIHRDRLDAAGYRSLASVAETQVAFIVANCKLPPDADAALHEIIGEIGAATETMAGKSKLKPRQGAVKLVEALDAYGRQFDHPGWKPLPH